MKLLVVYFSLHLSLFAHCQALAESNVRSSGLNAFLGDTILKFNHLLSCATQTDTESVNFDLPWNCRMFRFLPASTDAIGLGGVKFPVLLLEIDVNRIISLVDFIKDDYALGGKDEGKQVKRDYRNLIAFLDSSLGMGGKRINYSNNQNSLQFEMGRCWQKDKVKYILKKTNIYRRPQLPYILEFSYSSCK